MKRSQKLALLTDLVTGKASQQTLTRLKQQREVFFVVVCDNGQPTLTDLVDTRLPDEQGRKQVPYGDFLKSPAAYGSCCITVDKEL